MKKIVVCLILIFNVSFIWAGGQEEAASSGSGEYLAEQGQIIPASEIRISSYISQIDYNYPRPEENLEVTFVTGNDFFSQAKEAKLFQVGIQAVELDYQDLPPFNLCFVVDASGSMAGEDKIVLALEGLTKTISRLRNQDKIAIVTSGLYSNTVLPSTLMNSTSVRERAYAAIDSIQPEGVSSIRTAVETAYEICENNFLPSGGNRIILLSDGNFPETTLENIAGTYKEKGINITTIGFGIDFNSAKMINIAKAGGGSSRFIGHMEQVEEHFYTDLDRMVVPFARDLEIELRFHLPIEKVQTWGYRHKIEGPSISYFLPTIHHRDYETILAEVYFARPERYGSFKAAELNISYSDTSGNRIQARPQIIYLDHQEESQEHERYVNPYLLKSSLMLQFARNLISISEINDIAVEQRNFNLIPNPPKMEGIRRPELPHLDLERNERGNFINIHYEQMIDLTLQTRKSVFDAEQRLGESLFDSQKKILEKYIEIIGQSLYLPPDKTALYTTGFFSRVPLRSIEIPEALDQMTAEVTAVVDASGSILFPGIIYANEDNLSSGNLDVENRLRQLGFEVIHAIENTSANQYSHLAAAVMAGKATRSDYVLIIHIVDSLPLRTIYAKLMRSISGDVIATSQKTIE